MSHPNVSPLALVAPSARFDESVKIRDHVLIEPDVYLDSGVNLEEGVSIGASTVVGSNTSIYRYSAIGRGVVIGPDVYIDSEVLIMDDAQICPNPINLTHSSDARRLMDGVSIGPGVLLHDEVELGYHAIVPTQRTIAHLGHLGAKNRVVTIYGDDEGPLISVGCQIGVTLRTLEQRVATAAATLTDSANTYKPFLTAFSEIGQAVQQAYEKEAPLVQEIKAVRAELNLNTSPTDMLAAQCED